MKLTMLGGNAYRYGFAPAYIKANGKGYITGRELLGADTADTTDQTDPAKTAQGGNQALDFFTNLINKGAEVVDDITGVKKNTVPAQQQQAAPKDNTVLIVGAGIAGVALLAIAMRNKKRRRR